MLFAGAADSAPYPTPRPSRSSLPQSLTQSLPQAAQERLVIRTDSGDLVFQLFRSIAPKHVEQIVKLVRAGVMDTTHFFRLEKNFVLQLSVAQERISPLNPSQIQLIRKIPLEPSTVPHKRGTLSMARVDGDINSGETSFSILLGPGPHLDGKYTVFGQLESGWDVLAELEKIPVDGNKPKIRIAANRLEIWDAAALGAANLRRAQRGGALTSLHDNQNAPTQLVVLGTMMFLGLLVFFLRGAASAQILGSIALLVVLVGAFGLFLLLGPVSQKNPWIAAGIFIGLISLFRLMNGFESPGK